MRNFLRGLKFSWAYRRRFLLSVVCALMVAVLWSLNLSAIFPVLKILSQEKNLHTWVDEQIDEYQTKANDPKRQAETEKLQAEIRRLEDDPAAPDRENTFRRLHRRLAELQAEANYHHTWAYRYQLLKSQVIRHLPTNRFETFLWIIAAVIVGVAIKGFFDFWQESLVGSVVNRTLFDLRNQLFRATVHQDPRQVADTGTPDLMARFTNDMETFGLGMKTLYGKLVVEPLKAVSCVVAACFISWQLTCVFLVLVPLAMVTLTKVSKWMRKAAKRLLERMSDIYKILRETFDGIRVVKGFTREPKERRRFRRATADYYRKAMRVVNIDAFAGPMVELLGIVALCLALSAGAFLVLEKERRILGLNMSAEPLEFTTLLQLYVFLAAVADPVRKLSSVYTKIQGGAVAADRIFQVFDAAPEVKTNAGGPSVPRHSRSVEFRNVCFSYIPGQETLSNVQLKVRAGETVAIVGPNGCGKSTLLGLLPRFYDPDFGVVLVDGVNVREANLRSLRRQIGIVSQDTVLFDGTVGENIAYGRPGATPEQVEDAARQAFAHEFVAAMPAGYDTPVGENGGRLSGGQKQRIALARAILRDPAILILDEFTSAIDADSETKIHQALRTFVRGRTTFLITHRLASLDIASRIVVMDAGKLIAVGTHTQLLAVCPLYQRLYEAQAILRGDDGNDSKFEIDPPDGDDLRRAG